MDQTVKKKKFADTPRRSYTLLQLALMLPTTYVFCFLSEQRLPITLREVLTDVSYGFLSLFLFIPALLVSMLGLKLLFYGSVMGVQRRVSLTKKNFLTFLFIALAILIATPLQTELFLWLSGRKMSDGTMEMLANAFWMFIAGLPGFLLSLKELLNKIAMIKKKESSL